MTQRGLPAATVLRRPGSHAEAVVREAIIVALIRGDSVAIIMRQYLVTYEFVRQTQAGMRCTRTSRRRPAERMSA